MHLNKLFMHNFKKFRRAEVEFQDGLTGIVGGNGAGKSTIVEAIAVFIRKPGFEHKEGLHTQLPGR